MSIINKINDYLKGSVSEMKKVVWPTKKQTIRYSSIVIALSLGVALFFGVLDYVLNLGLEAIISDNQGATETATTNGSAPVDFEVSDVSAEGAGSVQVETAPSYETKPAE